MDSIFLSLLIAPSLSLSQGVKDSPPRRQRNFRERAERVGPRTRRCLYIRGGGAAILNKNRRGRFNEKNRAARCRCYGHYVAAAPQMRSLLRAAAAYQMLVLIYLEYRNESRRRRWLNRDKECGFLIARRWGYLFLGLARTVAIVDCEGGDWWVCLAVDDRDYKSTIKARKELSGVVGFVIVSTFYVGLRVNWFYGGRVR